MKIILLLLLLIIIINYLDYKEYFIESNIPLESEEEIELAQWFERATELKLDILNI
jgi:hypothetical protein|tara:strand:- start:308 stop:475 length:168 start_codon:yes stop_codon:yes gene_type:complete